MDGISKILYNPGCGELSVRYFNDSDNLYMFREFEELSYLRYHNDYSFLSMLRSIGTENLSKMPGWRDCFENLVEKYSGGYGDFDLMPDCFKNTAFASMRNIVAFQNYLKESSARSCRKAYTDFKDSVDKIYQRCVEYNDTLRKQCEKINFFSLSEKIKMDIKLFDGTLSGYTGLLQTYHDLNAFLSQKEMFKDGDCKPIVHSMMRLYGCTRKCIYNAAHDVINEMDMKIIDEDPGFDFFGYINKSLFYAAGAAGAKKEGDAFWFEQALMTVDREKDKIDSNLLPVLCTELDSGSEYSRIGFACLKAELRIKDVLDVYRSAMSHRLTSVSVLDNARDEVVKLLKFTSDTFVDARAFTEKSDDAEKVAIMTKACDTLSVYNNNLRKMIENLNNQIEMNKSMKKSSFSFDREDL